VRVLVTGVTGFTGGHLAKALMARGHEVRALVRKPEEVSFAARGPGDTTRSAADIGSGLTLVTGDLRDRASLDNATDGVDVVYNIAAIYRQAGLPADTYRAVNATAVGDLVSAASRGGVRRVVHCSTVGVHGDVEHPPANEDAPLGPGDVYQITKLEGERLGRETGEKLGIEVTIVRPSGIYGPGDRRLLKLFRGVARRRWATLGSGEIYYHLTYIDDLVEGFQLCGEHPAAANRTYILAGGEVTTLNQLVKRVATAARVPAPRLHLPVWPFWTAGALCEAIAAPFGIEPPIYRRRVDFFTKSRAFDIARARQELGYDPQVGLDEGIRRTLDWYREHGWL
jgi:nucleoside-diphosphate-sugar epimerase